MIRSAALVASVSRKAGGLFESVRRLCQSLQDAAVGVDVLGCLDEHTPQDLPQWNPLAPVVFPVRGPRDFGFAPGLFKRLLELEPDIVHTHGIWMYPSVVGLLWERRTRRPMMISAHGMLDPWAYSNSRWKKVMASFVYESRHLRRASCLRALSASEAASIRRLGLKNPICIIPNGIDLPAGQTHMPCPWADRVESGKKVLLYLGRFHPKKGLSNLLIALDAMRKSGGKALDSWAVALAGRDQLGHEEILKRQARDLGLEKQVLFLGPQFDSRKAACYANADAFVLPSLSEGLPMVVLEAWAYGLPVLMTPQCNLPEGYQTNAAIRIEAGVDSITRGLEELFAMADEERRTMGDRGRALVVARFSWPRIAADMRAVYEWLLGGGEPPACVWRD